MKSKDEVDWLKNVLKNALPNKTVKSDLVLTSTPTKCGDKSTPKADDFR
jgi:disulfide oxidoreductase YuzD